MRKVLFINAAGAEVRPAMVWHLAGSRPVARWRLVRGAAVSCLTEGDWRRPSLAA